MVCTNEGNADMGTSFAKVHIATFGMEKIVPNREALGVFTRLLARSGTGQPITLIPLITESPLRVVNSISSLWITDEVRFWPNLIM